jgi:hypothetical protein
MVVISLFKHGKVLSEEKQRDEEKYLELLHTGFTSHQFYFSYEFDVTHRQVLSARVHAEWNLIEATAFSALQR